MMTKDGIAHWCDGIGDYRNPLYRDPNYAAKTKYGTIVAPPCSLNSILNVSGMRVGGLPRCPFFPFRLGLAVAETGVFERYNHRHLPPGGYRREKRVNLHCAP